VVGVALAALLVAGGCADDDTGSGTAPPTAVSADSTTVGTTVPSTVTTSETTTGPAATSEPAATTVTTTGPAEECTDQFGVDPVSENFPQQLSGLVVRDARTGDHPCFERVVIEFEGTGEFPGYRVEYVADPVHLSPSDLTVEIAGAATLVLAVGTWLTNTEGEGYAGAQQIFPTNVQHIDELRVIENFEGMHEWAIGLDEQRGFHVTTLLDPPRIVIDIAVPST
jgi:hypothetical protein